MVEKKQPACIGMAVLAWLFVLALIVYSNVAIWPMYDEWVYTVKSAKDILPEVWHEYFVWNGRIINTVFARVYSLLPIGVVDGLICLGWLIYLYLIGYLALGRQWRQALLHWYTALLVWSVALFFILDLWFTSLWHTGTTSYLWTANIAMGFFAVFRDKLCDAHKNDRPWSLPPLKMLLMAPLALLAGWSNYNIGPTVFVVFACFLLWKRREIRPVWPMLALLALVGIGALAMNVAPGNMVRADLEGRRDLGLISCLRLNALQLQHLTFIYLPAFVMMALGMAAKWYKREWRTEDTLVVGFACACALLATLAYLPSPLQPTPYSFHFIGTMYAVAAVRIFFPYVHRAKSRWIWLPLLLTVSIFPAYQAWSHWPRFLESYQRMEDSFAVVETLKNTNSDVIIPRQHTYQKFPWRDLTDYWGLRRIGPFLSSLPSSCSGYGISPDADTHFNRAAAKAWGVRSVRAPYYQASYTANTDGVSFTAKEFLRMGKKQLVGKISGSLPDSETLYIHYALPRRMRGLELIRTCWLHNNSKGLKNAFWQQLMEMGYEIHTLSCQRGQDGQVHWRMPIAESWVVASPWISVSANPDAHQCTYVPVTVEQNDSARDYDPETGEILN